jgi:hypothetical protein
MYQNMDIEDDYLNITFQPGFYSHDVQPWGDWKVGHPIATLSCPGESGPLLQMKDTTNLVALYEFKLKPDNTLTIFPYRQEVKAHWQTLAQNYQLQRDDEKDFRLADVFCFLQSDSKLPIEPQEVDALRNCVKIVAVNAIERLEHRSSTIILNRSPVLQCELKVFTLCLRKESKDQSELNIQVWLENRLYGWASAELLQVMTTKTQTAVELTAVYKRDGNERVKDCTIHHHMSELNQEGKLTAKKALDMPGRFSCFQRRWRHNLSAVAL